MRISGEFDNSAVEVIAHIKLMIEAGLIDGEAYPDPRRPGGGSFVITGVKAYAAGQRKATTLCVALTPKTEPRLRCGHIFTDDGTQCRRSRKAGFKYCDRCSRLRKRESTQRSKAKTNLKEEMEPRKCLSANGRKNEFRQSATVTLGQAKTPQISAQGSEAAHAARRTYVASPTGLASAGATAPLPKPAEALGAAKLHVLGSHNHVSRTALRTPRKDSVFSTFEEISV